MHDLEHAAPNSEQKVSKNLVLICAGLGYVRKIKSGGCFTFGNLILH